MYSDLFDQLGASGRLAGRGGDNNNNTDNEPAPLVSFKAGKMELTSPTAAAAAAAAAVESPAATSSSNNTSFQCTPNKTRGEVRLVWKNRALQWQWYDRRDRKVVDTWKVQDYAPNSTFERINFTPDQEKAHAADRIYVWTRFPNEQQQQQQQQSSAEESKEQDATMTTTTTTPTPEYQMFWMQDASDEKDDELVAQVNQYLTDPQSAAPEGEADRMDTTETTTTTSVGGSGIATAGSTTNNQSQVDALSSILENLGMPQAGSSDTASDTAAAATSAAAAAGTSTSATTGTLTLADLQGAMAGIHTQQEQPGPSLSSIITPDAITSLLQDEGARTRLMELLPEEQRTADQLEENLRSPQVQQTLRSLTATLLPDSAGDLSGLYSAMANFQLEPADGQEAMAAGNPIQAFLDALLKKVEREEQQQEEEAKESEEKNDNDDDDVDEDL